MSYVHKIGLIILAFIFTTGCSKQDPLISLIGFSSLSPKLSSQGPYIVNDSHFSTPFEITGQCSSEIKNLQIKLEAQDWTDLTTLLSNSDADCSDENFKIIFKLEELGFSLSEYNSKSLWLRSVSPAGESEPQEMVVTYNNSSPPPTTPQATVPTINSITYKTNTEVDIEWSLPSDHNNDKVIISIQNGNVTADCSLGIEVAASEGTTTTTLSSGSGTTSFDLLANDITISLCGKNSEHRSAPVFMFFYKTPGTISYDPPLITNEQIKIQNIISDGASYFNVQYSLANTEPPPCVPSMTISPGQEYVKNQLAPDTAYRFRICAYNNNSDPQKKYVITATLNTMKDRPATPTGFSITQSPVVEKGLKIIGLNSNLIYNIDFAPIGESLTNDYLSAKLKNQASNPSGDYEFTVPDYNTQYVVRIWAIDDTAYPQHSEDFVDKKVWSHLRITPADNTHSKKWGQFIQKTTNDAYDMSDFSVACDASFMYSQIGFGKCINSGLLWKLPLTGENICNEYTAKAYLAGQYLEKVPFQ